MSASFVVRRLLQALAVVLALTLTVSALLRMLPGGPAKALLGPRASPEAIAAFEHQTGLDQPFLVQYLTYLDRLFLHADLGFSYGANRPVSAVLGHDLPRSIVLVGLSTLIALAIGTATGLFQATFAHRLVDHLLSATAFTLYAIPGFFLALALVDLFAVRWHLLPTEGPQGDSWSAVITEANALVLPVATLALGYFAIFTRYVRAGALDALNSAYVHQARAKGLSRQRVLGVHVLRNISASVVTLLGFSLPSLLSGAIVVEAVFNYPGIGLEAVRAATDQDYAVLLGLTVVIGLATTAGSLLADLTLAALDPQAAQ